MAQRGRERRDPLGLVRHHQLVVGHPGDHQHPHGDVDPVVQPLGHERDVERLVRLDLLVDEQHVGHELERLHQLVDLVEHRGRLLERHRPAGDLVGVVSAMPIITGAGGGASAAHLEWQVWNLEARLVVTDAARLDEAARIAREVLAEVDAACSRFRADSELTARSAEFAVGAPASPMLTRLVRAALDAAEWTHGDVDPSLGDQLGALGYDRDIAEVRARSEHLADRISIAPLAPRRSTWRDIRLDGDRLTVPEGVLIDLGATAKAVAADRVAERVQAELDTGVLVGLGGDLATAGPRDEAWQVVVQDRAGEPGQQISLEPGWAVATSSTLHRRWRAGGKWMHHVLDPRSGLPAPETWRTVTVAAPSCLRANALSTAAIVRGHAATRMLADAGVAARLVDARFGIHRVGGWPEADAERTLDHAKEPAHAR
ncbi:MAG: FAD:protein FMN transferase [Microbacteriaceae bacterium]|nr:FAD:protein FMN transferase [Microbacteriaceae bacterium]